LQSQATLFGEWRLQRLWQRLFGISVLATAFCEIADNDEVSVRYLSDGVGQWHRQHSFETRKNPAVAGSQFSYRDGQTDFWFAFFRAALFHRGFILPELEY
jgi:hypothetical protein